MVRVGRDPNDAMMSSVVTGYQMGTTVPRQNSRNEPQGLVIPWCCITMDFG